jgi:hypothetical protein
MIPMTLAIPAPIPAPLFLIPGLAPVAVAVIALLVIAAAAAFSVMAARRSVRGPGLRVMASATRSRRTEQRPLAA